jgi:asparagine synthetase B (glutamine-hydrolysing)
MPSIIASFGKKKIIRNNNSLVDKIDQVSNQIYQYIEGSNYEFLIKIRRSDDPGMKFYEDDRWFCILVGDVPSTMSLKWESIIDSILKSDWSKYHLINAPHMIICVDKLMCKSYVFSDRRSQYPVFLYKNSETIIISNTISEIVSSGISNKINKNWILEYIFFNYPVMNTSLLESVTKMSPASCAQIDIEFLEIQINEYLSMPRRSSNPLKGQEEIDYVADVFKSTVQDYSGTSHPIWLPLTGGLDSQTILACLNCIGLDGVKSYTYGTENSEDILAARKIICRYEIPHQTVDLEDDFLENLPHLIEKTVYLSGGMERVLRSTLAYVYQTIQKDEPRRVLSGVSGDHIFRDHIRGRGNVPSIISSYFMDYIQGKKIDECFDSCIINFDKDERKYLCNVIEQMNYKYGDLRHAEGYSNFLMFECGPKYFAGEAAVASQFGAFNSIYWDNRIVNLLYEIDNSTIGLSKKFKEKNYFYEKYLQSNIIYNFASKRKHVNCGIPIDIFASGNLLYYFFAKVLLRCMPKIKNVFIKEKYCPLENWELWINYSLNSQFRSLILKNSHIHEYISLNIIEDIFNSNDFRMKAKIVNIEIILRLVENGWKYGVVK